MYTNILLPVALEHDDRTAAALKVASQLVAEGGRITALTVMEPVPAFVMAELPEGQGERNRATALQALKAVVGDGVEAVVVSGHPGRTIVDYADAQGSDCIVIASHQPGLQDYFLGSTAARVVRHAHCAVHVIR